MIRCEEFRAALYEFAAGELPPDRQRDLETHLGECQACARELEEYRRVMQLGCKLPEVAPPRRLLERLRQAMDQDEEGLNKADSNGKETA